VKVPALLIGDSLTHEYSRVGADASQHATLTPPHIQRLIAKDVNGSPSAGVAATLQHRGTSGFEPRDWNPERRT